MSSLPLLASPVELFAWLQQPLDQSSIPQVETYLRLASGTVRAYLGQAVTEATYTETLSVEADGSVYLPQGPVTAVTSVVDATSALGVIYSAVYLGAGIVTVPIDPDTCQRPVAVVVSWQAGYPVEEIPDGIVSVVVQVAARGYASPAGVQAESLGGWSVHYQKGFTDLSADDRAALDRYRWVGVG